MANTLKIKRSAVQGRVPTAADLQLGELAINTYDGKLYLKKDVGGTETIVDVTAGGYTLPAATAGALGGVRGFTNLTIDGSGNLSLVAANVNAALGYTAANAASLASYLPLAGGTLSGALVVNANDGLKAVYGGTDGQAWYRGWGMESDRANVYVRGTANATQTLRIGYSEGSQSWLQVRVDATNFTQNGNQVLHAGNYTSYSPSLTGSGASGTWGINVTGNAATVTNGVVTTGSYADPAWITSLAASKLTGTIDNARLNGGTYTINITGNAATATSATDSTKLPLSGGTLTGLVSFSGIYGSNRGALRQRVIEASNASGASSGFVLIARFRPGSSWGSGAGVEISLSADYYNNNPNFTTFTFGRDGTLRLVYAQGTLVNNLRVKGPVTYASQTDAYEIWVTLAAYQRIQASVRGYWGSDTIQAGSNDCFEPVAAPSFTTSDPTGLTAAATVGFLNLASVSTIGTTTDGGYRLNVGGTLNATGAITQAGNQVLHAGNYTSYSPSLTGSGASGTWSINVTGNAATVSSITSGQVTTALGFTPYNATNPSGYITSTVSGTFTVNGSNGVRVFVDGGSGIASHLYFANAANNRAYNWQLDENSNAAFWGYGGSAWAKLLTVTSGGAFNAVGAITQASNQVLHAGNYNSYSPTLTGGGASGTWGISITGNAATSTSASSSAVLAYAYSSNSDLNTVSRTNALTAFNVYYPSGGSYNQPLGGGQHFRVLQFGHYNQSGDASDGNAWRGQIAMSFYSDRMWFRRESGSSWVAWKELIHTDNYSSYSPSLTGSGASGTWGISITGNAATATTASNVPASGITGQTGMWTSAARPGPYRLYRRDNDSDYSVQTYWTGTRWRLYGYNGDSAHADTHVGYADSTNYATNAGNADTVDNRHADYFYPAYTDTGYVTGDINGNGTNQRLWGTDSVQDMFAFNPPTTVEYSTNGSTWTSTSVPSIWTGKINGMYGGFNLNVGNNVGGWRYVRLTWQNFGYRFWSHLTLAHSTNGHSFNLVFYKSNTSGVFGAEAFRINNISSWPGYTFAKYPDVSGWWDTRDVRIVFELNHSNDYANNAISIGHIGMMGSYGGFTRLYDWDGDRTLYFANAKITGSNHQVLHAGNYNSYAPTLTGTGASGTWGINITGNAATATSATDSTKLPLSGGTLTGALTAPVGYFRKNQTNGDYTTAPLWTESYGNTTTGIAFHISGVVGRFLEMRTNGSLYWNGSIVLNDGNYTTYVGNGALSVTAGAGLTGGGQVGTANQSGNSGVTISHADTSSQASVDGSGGTVIQDVTLDDYGHVTALGTVNLDDRYLRLDFPLTSTVSDYNSSSGTWNVVATSTAWGSYKPGDDNAIGYSYNDAPGWLQYNVPSGYSTVYIGQLRWSSGGYFDVHAVRSDGALVFRGRYLSLNSIENSDHSGDYDGQQIIKISGLDGMTAVRITNVSGRLHFQGLGWTKEQDTANTQVSETHWDLIYLKPTLLTSSNYTSYVGNGTLTVQGSNGLSGSGTFTANQTGAGTITLSHADTSSLATGAGGVGPSGPFAAGQVGVLTALTVDDYGHVTNFSSATVALASAYLPLTGGTMTGAITFAAGQTWPTFNQSTTGNAATATTLATGRTIGMTGDVTWTSGSFNGSANVTGTATLVNSGATAGTYGGNNSIPSLTVDAKGRVTVASTVTPSGTWGISISGNAATATTVGQIDGIEFRNGNSTNGTGPDNVTDNGTGYINSVSLFGQTDGALYSQAYSSSWVHQIFGDYRTGQLAVRGRNSGTWQSWRSVLDSSNYSSYALPLSGGTLSGAITSSAASLVVGQQGGTTRGYLYNDSGGFGFLSNAGNWAAYVPYNTQNFKVLGDVYAGGHVTSQNTFGFRNRLINGSMSIWQRGTGAGTVFAPNRYIADRWYFYSTGTASWAQSTDVPSGQPFSFSLRFGRPSGNVANTPRYVYQVIENAQMRDLAGKTVTLSYWIKSGANYSGASPYVFAYSGTVADQGAATALGSWTGSTQPLNLQIGVSSSWYRYVHTLNVPADAKELAVGWYYTPAGTAGADDFLYVAGAEVQLGAFDTSNIPAFDFVDQATELQRCQRYYEIGEEPLFYIPLNLGVSSAYDEFRFAVTKRTAPTMVASGWTYYSQGTGVAFTPNFQASTTRVYWANSGFSNWYGWAAGGTWTASAEL